MRYLLVSVLLVILCASAAFPHSAMNRFWGEVPVDMLLSGDVLITKPLVIPRDVTLTIEPGTVVRFEDTAGADNRIVVRGRLVADGTKDKPVMFVPRDEGSAGWRGIIVEPGGGGSMKHCVLEGASIGIDDPDGGLKMSGVEVR